jgi:hypothetical protein
VSALCIFGDDLDPSKAGNRSRFGEDMMNSSWCLSARDLRFRLIGYVWGSKILDIASHRDASYLPQILSQSIQRLGRSIYRKFGVESRAIFWANPGDPPIW